MSVAFVSGLVTGIIVGACVGLVVLAMLSVTVGGEE